jgi:membrane associated rhomboid family serine protease
MAPRSPRREQLVDQPSEKRSVPAFNVPAVVVASLAAFVAVHLYRLTLSQEADIEFLLRFAFIPARYVSTRDLGGVTFPGGLAADIWTFVTYGLIHGDWVHLAMNSLWMLAFGSVVARRMGTARFLAFNIACAAAGAAVMLWVLWGRPVPLIGASAAVSGQLAAAVRVMFGGGTIHAPASMGQVLRDPRAVMFFGVWVGINLMFGLGAVSFGDTPGEIAWEAHLGGFAAGFLLFGVIDRFGRPQWPPELR